MAEFKPMIKMETDEPSVILKLKKGGHVNMKHHGGEHEHKSMKHMAMGGMMPPMMPPTVAGNPMARAMAARRRPMIGATPPTMNRPMIPPQAPPMPMNAPTMKKGGKMHHKAKGGEVEGKGEQKAEMREMHKIEKELKHHEHMPAGKAHHGLKHGGKVHHKYAKGGKVSGDHLGSEIDSYQSRNAIKGNERQFLQTKVVGATPDKAHGTGQIKESNAGGYKHGGKVHHMTGHAEGTHEHHKAMAKHYAEKCKDGGSTHMHKMHEHHKHMAKMCKGGEMGKYAIGGTVSDNRAKDFLETKLVDADKRDTAHGTGQIKESNAGGYKHGGKVHHKFAKGGMVENSPSLHSSWENRPANGTPAGKTNGKTGEVREANAGGYRHGGKVRKYASGGMVDSGKAEKMPQGRKPASKAVHITELAGTFKKGGHVRF
jgi:hypothetical protein